MKRIYAEPDDQTMEEIARVVEEKGINRHHLVLKAIDSYLHHNGSETDSLRKELDSLRSERDSLKSELDKRWAEIRQLRSENETQKIAFDSQTIKVNQAAIKIDSLGSELKQSEIVHDGLRKDLNHANDIIKLKDEEISYLKSAYHELVQKLPKMIAPSDEEIKKKGWWQFWK